MGIQLYELVGAESERRFSPFCWRAHFSLLHKQLPFETIPWRFSEKEMLAFSGQGKVPVLVDGDRVVVDSWAIAEYLEEQYPQQPSLFGGLGGKALARFVTDWVETSLHPLIFCCVATDIYNHLAPSDRDYFRQTREAFLGMTLEAACGDRENRVLQLRERLAPLRQTLQYQPYLSGEQPAWADWVVFSAFQWSRAISPFPLLATNDPVFAWREQLLKAFDGAAQRSLAYAA
ncbi:MAG: glutathione S-transferase family protein [Chloroflexaceae bacterium]|nr:glutathione S-transferase family protein [Chloroflexaceae bacterium]